MSDTRSTTAGSRLAAAATVERPVRAGGLPVEPYRPPYLIAALVGFGIWLLYAITLAPSTAFWDTSEYIATAHNLGIPHPPGNPLFVVLARAWELLLAPTGLSVAVRINLFSATMSAAAHAFWFLMVHRILAYYTTERTFRLVGAVVAVVVSATAFTVWNHSNVNEKVYTVSLFTIALLSWLAFRWRDNLGVGKDDNLILLMVFILALSVGNHLMAFLAAPALILFILLVQPRALTNWKLYAAGAIAVAIGLSIHLFLPIRASLDPVINEADPSTMQALMDALMRRQYDKPSIFTDPTLPGQEMPRTISQLLAQIGHYLQYFDWQWARSVAGNVHVFGGMRPLFTVGFVLLGLYGAYAHYRHDRTSWVYVATLFLTLSLGLVIYLNFRYGYTWRPNIAIEMREVRERDYFFIVGFSVWGLWAGLGLAAIWRRLSEDLVERVGAYGRAQLVTAPVLGIALIPLALNWSWASRAGDYAARDWAYNLLQSTEPYAVLFTNGDNDTFPLWYLQEVEGIRRDVTVIVMSYLNTPWYVKQLKQLTSPCGPGEDPAEHPDRIICQRPYDGDGPTFYDAAARRGPERSIIPLSAAEVDRIANTPPFATNEDLVFRAAALETSIPAATVMIPADIFMTAILTTAIGDRPIYYATTTQAYQELNLRPFLIRHGVAYKLNNGPVDPDAQPGVYALPDGPLATGLGPYIDLPRTDALLDEVYIHRSGLPDEWSHWVDDATQNIPVYYGYAHYVAAQVHALLGNQDQAERHARRAEVWLNLAQEG
ncbi:MAG: glycosyltransferase family 117 protein [Longimicrobiales bacterium]